LQIKGLLIDDSFYQKNDKLNQKGKDLFTTLQTYKSWLLTLKILDPACGSGAFLNATLDFLIAEHKEIDNIISELTGDKMRIFDTDKQILENNIFGVDINEESVEIAKLSLWLRTAQKGRALSDLTNNIKCGNSLIDDPEVAGEKAFDWNVEFKEIMDNGGFDVVIGNPPWGANIAIPQRLYIQNKYKLSKGLDSSEYFIHLLDKFLKKGGYFSFIVPKSIIFYKTWELVRKLIFSKSILFLADVGLAFESVNLEAIILGYQNIQTSNNKIEISRFNPIKKVLLEKEKEELVTIPQKLMKATNIFVITDIDTKSQQIIEKIQNTNSFLKKIKYASFRGLYIPDKTKNIILDKGNFLYINKVPDVKRYKILTVRNIDLSNYEIKFKTKISQLNTDRIVLKVMRGKRLSAIFVTKEILTTEKLVNIVINDERIDIFYLLAVINSKLVSFYMQKVVFSDTTETSRVMDNFFLEKIPILLIDKDKQNIISNNVNIILILNKELQTEKQNFINTLKEEKHLQKITKTLENFNDLDFEGLKKEIGKQKARFVLGQETNEWRVYFNTTKHKVNELQAKINQTDKDIDRMVYELYELTAEEIEIVENASNK